MTEKISCTQGKVISVGVKVEMVNGPGILPGLQGRADPVGISQIGADPLHQAGGESTPSQDVIHDFERNVIRMGMGNPDMPQANLALGQFRAVDDPGLDPERKEEKIPAGFSVRLTEGSSLSPIESTSPAADLPEKP